MIKVRNYAVIIGSMILIVILLYVILYFLIIIVPYPWIAFLLIIVLFCSAIPLHNRIVAKLISSKAQNVQ